MPKDTEAAPPLLGSHLHAAARRHQYLTPKPASSGSASPDEKALLGGFRYGEITSIAGSQGTGKTLITYHAIASHLLTSDLGEVALIDTTGSFSPVRLRDVLAYRLEARQQRERYQESGYVYEKITAAEGPSKDDLIAKATSMLDRVKVMRVFDFAGVTEAVGEVNEMIEMTCADAVRAPKARATRKSGEVGDSEEELDDEEEPPEEPLGHRDDAHRDGKVGMIIVDSIANVVGSIMSKSQVQGQALLTSFVRSLHHLTSRNHICTVLTNSVVGVNPTDNPEYRRAPQEHVSVFASTMGKPALGKTFTYLVDTSIFLSTVPKTSNDATIAMNGGSCYHKALILEVLKDRCGTREGRWAALDIVAGIKLIPLPS